MERKWKKKSHYRKIKQIFIGISKEKGLDVDKPRNLAKSVTVE